jgi:hypothetical protein
MSFPSVSQKKGVNSEREPEHKAEKHSKNETQTTKDSAPWTFARVREAATAIFKQSTRPALVSTLGLLSVWLIGRVMETYHGKTIFDMTLTYWFGLTIYILMAIWAISFVISNADELRTARQRKLAILSWVIFILLTATLLVSFKGYRVSSGGLLATIAGTQDSSEMAIFLLYKYHYMNPLLTLNLAAAKIMGVSWGVQSFAPFVWSWNVLLGFFIWSVAFGILLLLHRDRQGIQVVYLVFSAFGLLGLIVLKSVSTPTIEQMSMIQAAATILIVAQVFLAYAALRKVAAGPVEHEPHNVDPFNIRQTDNDKALENRFAGLPPKAVALAMVLFLVVPLMADVHNQFLTASSSKRILSQVSLDENSPNAGFSAVADISIRTGPTWGDDVIGILPKGSHIQVRGKQSGWVEIGENKWIQEKYIKPHSTNNDKETIGSKTNSSSPESTNS